MITQHLRDVRQSSKANVANVDNNNMAPKQTLEVLQKTSFDDNKTKLLENGPDNLEGQPWNTVPELRNSVTFVDL